MFSPGVPVEQVASNAVEELKETLENNCCVDQHLQDQVRFLFNHLKFAMSLILINLSLCLIRQLNIRRVLLNTFIIFLDRDFDGFGCRKIFV